MRVRLASFAVVGLLVAAPASALASTAYIGVLSNPQLGPLAQVVFAVDTVTGQRTTLGPGGSEMVVTPDNKTVYVWDRGTLRALDTTTTTAGEALLSTPIVSSGRPRARLAITPDGSTLLVSGASTNAVTPFATATNQPGEPISVDGPGNHRLAAATDRSTPSASHGADLTFKTAATGTLRLPAKTLKRRGTSVRVALRCQSNVACRGKLKLTSGKRTCASGSSGSTATSASTRA